MPSFVFPKIYVTLPICKGPTISQIALIVYFSGELSFQVTADNGDNWEIVTLTSGTRTTYSFTNTGTTLQFLAIGNPGAVIETQTNDYGEYTEPGIKIEII